MKPEILAISAADKEDRSAYTHRIIKLAECLKQRSIECDYFFMPNNPPLDTETTASLFMPLWLGRLRRYDLIYCGAQEAGQALFFCKPFIKAKILLDVHGDVIAQSALANQIHTEGRKREASVRVKLIDRLAMSCADYYLTVSRYQTEAFVRQGLTHERISLIRNGVDLELFSPLPQPVRPKFTFGYIGEFQTWQGIDNLIAAFQLVDVPSIRLLVVGFRQGDQSIKKLFAEKFGSRVELVDRIDRAGMVELIRSVGILIIPRIEHQAMRNAFPTKFAEYASMARPIMVNDVDETADFIRKYGCGFVSSPKPDAMADVMIQAAGTPWEKLAEMGAAARKMAEENFSWQKIGDDYHEVILKLISNNRMQGRK